MKTRVSVSDYIQAKIGFDLALVAAVEGNGEEAEQLIDAGGEKLPKIILRSWHMNYIYRAGYLE